MEVTGITLDATSLVQSANQFNDPPSKGLYALVTYDVTYNGSDEGTPSADLAFTISGGDAVQYTAYNCGAVTPGDHENDFTTLEPGGSTSTSDCFDIPPAAVSGALLFGEDQLSFDSSDRVYWHP